MKRIFSFAMAAAIAFGFSSCVKDVDYGNGGDDEGGLVATFTLQTPKGAFITYADQIAEGAEWTVNNIDVYAFESGTMVGSGKLVLDTDYEVTSAPGAAVTTIKVKNSWLAPLAGKDVTFYFVGNDQAGANGAVKAPHIDPAKTTQADFEKQITKTLDVSGTPDLMSEIIRTPLLFSAKSEELKMVGRVQGKATLTRREARFDIVNKYAADGLVIDAVEISNAPRSGKIFADGGSETILWAGIDPTLITVPTVIGNYTSEQNTAGETVYRAKSVFYLYPTILGENAAYTEIVVKATMGGKTEYYTRATKDAQGNDIAAKEIVANYRYTLVLDPLSLTFDIETADYEDGGEVTTEAGGDNTFAGFSIDATGVSNPANWNGTTYKFDDNDNDVLVVTVDSKYGTAFETNVSVGDDSKITNFDIQQATPVITYGRNVQNVYTIKVPQTTEAGPFHISVTIYSPNGEAKRVITFTKGALTAEHVSEIFENNEVLGDIVAETLASLGEGKTLADITALNGTGPNGPSSLEGLENLPNLQSLNLGVTGAESFNLSLSGALDFSSVPQLTSINILGCMNVTDVDVTNNPALTSLNVSCVGISTLDVSNNPELITLNVYETGLTELDLSNNKKLQSLNVSGVALSSIDFDLPDLKTIDFGRASNENMSAYTTIDWSKMPNVTSMTYRGSFGGNLDASVGLSHPKVSTFTYHGTSNTTHDRVRKINSGYNLVKTVDVSGFPALQNLRVYSTPYLESITGTESLTKLHTAYLYLDQYWQDMGLQPNIKESFSLSSSNSLFDLRLSLSEIKNITLPELPALTQFLAQYCQSLEKIDVTKASNLNILDTTNSDPIPVYIDISNNKFLTKLIIINQNNVTATCTIKGWEGMPINPQPFTLTKNGLTTVNWE